MSAVACCCGHMRWEHERDGQGPCRRCGRGCPRFHRVGEGHGHAFEYFLILVVLIIMAGIWKLTHLKSHHSYHCTGTAQACRNIEEAVLQGALSQ